MIFKKKEFFLLIFLIFLQSSSGGRIGNFLESSFNDLEKTSKNEDLQNNILNKKDINLEKENKNFDDKKNIVEPNFSFDLCRLGCSIYDFIIENKAILELAFLPIVK